MSFSAGFSASGFSVMADNAIDYIVGSQAAGAGYMGANIQALGQQEHQDMLSMQRSFHADNQQLMGVLSEKSDEIMAVNQAGFSQVDATMRSGFTSLRKLSGVQIAVQAAGFAVVAGQLQGVRRDLRNLAAQGEQLVRLQRIANQRLDQLVDIAQRSLEVQEKILDALLTSRTVEAQQLLRQGWENLKHGYEQEALARFEQSLQHDNTVYVAHASLARLYRKRGEKARAEDHYVRASKFSSSVNADVHALACLEYATFLEDEGRLAECVAQLQYALQHADKPTWRFHLAELLARTGQAESALAELRRAIEGDDELFAGSMASQDLSRLGPQLVRLLAELDEARRRPGFEHLKAIAADTDRLDAIGSLDSPASAGLRRTTDELRQQAAATLRAIVNATYAELPGPTRRAYELRSQVAAAAESAPAKIVAPLRSWVDSWSDSIRRIQNMNQAGSASSFAEVLKTTVLALVAWGMVAGGALFLLAGLAPPEDDREIGPVMLGFGAVLAAAGVFLMLRQRRKKRRLLSSTQAQQQTRGHAYSAVATLLSHVVSAARRVVSTWSARVQMPALASVEQDLARTQLPPPAPIPPSLAPVFGQWQQLALTPFGPVPVFSVSPDGAVHAALPPAPMIASPA